MHNFNIAESAGCHFDYDVTTQADFLKFFADAGSGEANGVLATGPMFADPVNGCFALTAGSAAAGTGWVREVDRPGERRASLRVQDDGSLNRGAVQDYGVAEVPELEAEAAALVAEFTLGEPQV